VSPMQVTLNGEPVELPDDATIHTVLAHFGREDAGVAVAVNLDVIRREDFDATSLRDGDRIDIVTAVGGG